ncbi:outer membrane beta-barrel protein [Salmonella enterica]|nr:outer membrane beta-barrel protein [Salmonella enterica]
MKKSILATLFIGAFMASGVVNAAAPQHTISGGYAQSNLKAGGQSADDKPKGVNVKYRYEFNEKWGVASSFTYTGQSYDFYYAGSKVGDADLDYYSLSAGPAYRINDYFSVYGLVGFAHGRITSDVFWHPSSESKTSGVYGAGLQFNPFPNWVVDASYEYTKLGDVKVGTWTAGIGYRF